VAQIEVRSVICVLSSAFCHLIGVAAMLHSSLDDSQSPAASIATNSTSVTVCPKCRASVNRVPRRFIDRLMSLVHPVHRYHCRSFVCSWEGNLSCGPTESDRLEAPDANSEMRLPALLQRGSIGTPKAGAAPRPRESDTLPADSTSGARHAGAGSRDDSSIAPPARKRRTANSR
jgi:hypothetical protein